MADRFPSRWRWALAGAGLAAGLALAVILIANRQSPTRGDSAGQAPALSVIEARPYPFRLEARGYGITRPAETWQATASVAGRVVERHPRLKSGNILAKGARLLSLDPTRYRLAIASAEADMARLEAEERQLQLDESNTRQLLELEEERLELALRELDRFQRLARQDQISASRLDQQRRAVVAQRQAVARLENELSLIPVRRKRLRAQQDQARTSLEQAREDLADTRFEAPYDLRISQVDVELHDRASPGQKLFRAHSVEATEVEAHFPLPVLRRLVGAVLRPEARGEVLGPQGKLDLAKIDASVLLAGARDVDWQAKVARIASGLDPATRTVRVVVAVAGPYEQAAPPEHPALQPGMYVRVRLTAPSPEPRLVIPASAVHDGEVYRVTGEDRLDRQPVEVAFRQSDLAVIAGGLSAGDRVIVDDPVPAIDGSPVLPRRDKALEEKLRARAGGAGR